MPCKVLGRLDGRLHPLDGEEGGEVGGVGGDDDQGEEPPDAAHDPGGGGPGVEVGALLHQSSHGEPETVGQSEVILDDVAGVHTGVGGRPFVGGKSGKIKINLYYFSVLVVFPLKISIHKNMNLLATLVLEQLFKIFYNIL